MAIQDTLLKEIKECFLIEACDLLDKVETYLLSLEKNQSDVEAFDALFRVMHNLKGGGKSVGFNEISSLAHQAESLLVAIRAKEIHLTTERVGVLLACGDRLKKDIEILMQDHNAVLDHREVLYLLSEVQKQDTKISSPTPSPDTFQSSVNGSIATTMVTSIDHSSIQHPAHADAISSYETVISKENPPVASQAAEQIPMQAAQSISAQSSMNSLGTNGAAAGTAIINKPKQDDFVRVSLQKIEDLLNNFGEQVILQATLDHLKYDLEKNQEQALRTINQLNKLTYDLQQTTLALRMVSLRQLFSRMERTARDTAVSVNKKIEFISDGQDNEIDKTIAEALADPLTHMIRNAVDHGLEAEQERISKGKNPCGKITLRGFRKGGYFYLEIEDDGKGLDRERIFSKAVKSGLIKADAKLTEAETYDLIYANGFSTRDAATDISGRGVGMNVVKDSIRQLKGVCSIESQLGRGTKFVIRLPLTLAIFNGVIVKVSGQLYVIPNSDVERFLTMPKDCLRVVSQSREKVIELDGVIMPFVDLNERLRIQNDLPTTISNSNTIKPTLVVTRTGETKRALLVDEVIGQQRIVHKSLGPEVKSLKGAAGATILGDGSAAVILDVPALLNSQSLAA